MALLKKHSYVGVIVIILFLNGFFILNYDFFGGQGKTRKKDDENLQSVSPKLKKNEMNSPLVSSKRILVVSYWRSGSTFLGALIQSAPGVFYSYEPLHFLSTYSRMEYFQEVESSIELINTLFQCKFPLDYFNYTISQEWGNPNTFFMAANEQALELCKNDPLSCEDPSLYSSLCHEFPVHLMKTVRLPLIAVRRLIDASVYNQFKIVYLVRDPHGIMASRIHRDWCVHPSCTQASELCQQIDADLKAFQELDELYPNTFYKIKFEDLTANVVTETEKLFKFLGMEITSQTKEFLATHTNSTDEKEMRKAHSTIRDSKSVANAWHQLLNETMIASIDDSCSEVLTALNYEHNTKWG